MSDNLKGLDTFDLGYAAAKKELESELFACRKELKEAKSNAHSFRLLAEGQKMRADKLTAERDRLAKELEEAKDKIFSAKDEAATYHMKCYTQELHIEELTAEHDRLAAIVKEAQEQEPVASTNKEQQRK